jgi:hypothetical protein
MIHPSAYLPCRRTDQLGHARYRETRCKLHYPQRRDRGAAAAYLKRNRLQQPPGASLLDREGFYGLAEARVLIGGWRRHDNTVRPHSALGYRPRAPETIGTSRAEAPWMP